MIPTTHAHESGLPVYIKLIINTTLSLAIGSGLSYYLVRFSGGNIALILQGPKTLVIFWTRSEKPQPSAVPAMYSPYICMNTEIVSSKTRWPYEFAPGDWSLPCGRQAHHQAPILFSFSSSSSPPEHEPLARIRVERKTTTRTAANPFFIICH